MGLTFKMLQEGTDESVNRPVQEAAEGSDEEPMDTSLRMAGLRLPQYRSAMAQVMLVGLFAFCTV